MDSELIRAAESWARFFDKAGFSYWDDGKELIFGGRQYQPAKGYVTRIEVPGDLAPQDVNIFRRFMSQVISELRKTKFDA
jgi:hypothetical protein